MRFFLCVVMGFPLLEQIKCAYFCKKLINIFVILNYKECLTFSGIASEYFGTITLFSFKK